MTDGAYIGFKYFELKGNEKISVKVRSSAEGTIEISDKLCGEALVKINVLKCEKTTEFSCVKELGIDGIKPLYFTYKGNGKCDFISFSFC